VLKGRKNRKGLESFQGKGGVNKEKTSREGSEAIGGGA